MNNEHLSKLSKEEVRSLSQNLSKLITTEFDLSSYQTKEPFIAACKVLEKYTAIKFQDPDPSEKQLSPEKQVERIARASSCRYRKIKLEKNWWKQDGQPFIGFLKSNGKPVAVINRKGSGFYIIEPNVSSTLVDKTTEDLLLSSGFVFYTIIAEGRLKILELVKKSLLPNRRDIISVFMIQLGGTLLGLFLPYATQNLYDIIIPNADYSLLWQLLFGYAVVILCTLAFQFSTAKLFQKLQIYFQNTTQGIVWDRFLRFPLYILRKFPSGELFTRMRFLEEFPNTFNGQSLQIVFSSLFSIIYLFAMFYYSWRLALISIPIVLLGLFIGAICALREIPLKKRIWEYEEKLNSFTIQVINGIGQLRNNTAEKWAFMQWSPLFLSSQTLRYYAQNIRNYSRVSLTVLASFSSALIFGSIVYFLMNPPDDKPAAFTLGSFMAFLTAYNIFSQGSSTVIGILVSWVDILTMLKRTGTLFECPLQKENKPSFDMALKGKIEAYNLHFRYEPGKPYILKGANFELNPGEVAIISGPSGTGKSTLLRLLIGFETLEQGSILYDNQLLADMDQGSLRKQVGSVLQSSALFAGTVLDNILCGRECTEDQLQTALFLSGFDEVLECLPMKLQTVIIGKTSTLSGGETQRLLLARALLFNPRVLLLDEATSALDYETLKKVFTRLSSLKVTALIITHRLDQKIDYQKHYSLKDGVLISI